MILSLSRFRVTHNNMFLGPMADNLSIMIICLFISYMWSHFWDLGFYYFFYYFFSGFTLWRIITSLINESSAIYTSEYRAVIENTTINHHFIHLSTVFRCMLPIFYQIPLMIILSVYFFGLSYKIIFLIFFTLILFIFLYSLSLIISIVNLRFTDLGYFINVFVGLLFFFTPILWEPTKLEEARNLGNFVIYGNPIYWFIDFYRSIFSIKAFDITIIYLIIITTIITFMISFMLLAKYKKDFYIWMR